MKQLILTVIEDIIMVYFLSLYIDIDDQLKNKFIFFVTGISVIETTIFEDNYSMFLPIILSVSLIFSIYLLKERISLNDVVACVMFPAIIIITDLISLILLSIILTLDISNITLNADYIVVASLVAKLMSIVFFSTLLFLHKRIKNRLNYRTWWVLLPIWGCLFVILYFLGLSILYKNVDINNIRFITIILIFLSILLLILFYKIQKENEVMRRIELDNQKIYYIEKNKRMMNKLYDDISKIEHSSMYNFLHIKGLLASRNYEEIEEFVNKNINNIKKYKNILITENEYFNYVINKKINELILYNSNIKICVTLENKYFQIEESVLNSLTEAIDIIFRISDKNKSFNINFYQMNIFLKTTIIFQKNKYYITEKEEYINSLAQLNINYSYKEVEDYCIYTIIIELGG